MRIVALAIVMLLTACNEPTPQTLTITPPAPPSEQVAQLFSRSCALCHVTGVAGAPRVGNSEEWHPRLVQGRDVLLEHTIAGYNSMPPLGYCMGCEEADFVSMIEMMSGASLENLP